MRVARLIALALAFSGGCISAAPSKAQTFFSTPPTKITLHNPSKTEGQRNRTTLSIAIPVHAGASLRGIKLTQLTNLYQWDWRPEEPSLYTGPYALRGEGEKGRARLKSIDEPTALNIVLDPPGQPGEQVNIVMRGINPKAGIYQWSVELIPDGPDPLTYSGPTLRLDIYENEPFY